MKTTETKKVEIGDIYISIYNGKTDYNLIIKILPNNKYLTVPVVEFENKHEFLFHKRIRNKNFSKNTYALFENITIKKSDSLIRFIDNVQIKNFEKIINILKGENQYEYINR